MTAGRIIIWRHGETDWNVDSRFQGRTDIALNARGRAQVAAAAPALAKLAPNRVLSSDLVRALDTARAVTALTGQRLVVDPRFAEIDVGSWAGLTLDQIAELEPDRVARLRAGEDVRRSVTGETVAEAATRFAQALGEYAEQAADGATLLVAAHGLVARTGSGAFLGMDPAATALLSGMDNAGWLIMDRRAPGWRLTAYNHRA